MDAPLLNGGGDYAPVAGIADAKYVFMGESKKLWAIATPIAFNILCMYATNSVTQIFVGHIGNLELAACSIGLSVVSLFSFGFLVSKSNPIPLLLLLLLLLRLNFRFSNSRLGLK